MKRLTALLLTFALCASLFAVTAVAMPAPGYVDEEPHTLSEPYNNDLVFNNGLNYPSPVIYYRPFRDDTAQWQSAPLTYYDYNEYGEDQYFFNFPGSYYLFYIAGGDRRSKTVLYDYGNIIAYFEDVTVDFSYTGDDESGYDGLALDMMTGANHSDELTQPDPDDAVRQRYAEQLEQEYGDGCQLSYQEVYAHRDADGALDWILLSVSSDMVQPMGLNTIVSNRVIMDVSRKIPFSTGYGVYDVKNDTFRNIAGMTGDEYDGFGAYYDLNGRGRLLGDLDKDNELTIVDATVMQRCDLGTRAYPSDDLIEPLAGLWTYSVKYYSDFNRDGDRDIVDATALQRYLLGLPFKKG